MNLDSASASHSTAAASLHHPAGGASWRLRCRSQSVQMQMRGRGGRHSTRHGHSADMDRVKVQVHGRVQGPGRGPTAVASCSKHVQLHRACATVVVASNLGEDIVCRLNTGVDQGDYGPNSRSRAQCSVVSPYSSCKCATKASFEVASCCKQSCPATSCMRHSCRCIEKGGSRKSAGSMAALARVILGHAIQDQGSMRRIELECGVVN